MCTTPPVIVPAKVQQRQSLLKCVTAQIQGAFLSGVVTRWEGISRFEIIFVVWKINPKWKRILLNNSRKGNGWGSLQWAINEIFFSCFHCSLPFFIPILPSRVSIAKFSTGERAPLTFPPASHPLWNQSHSQPPSVRFCEQLGFFLCDNDARFSPVFVMLNIFEKCFKSLKSLNVMSIKTDWKLWKTVIEFLRPETTYLIGNTWVYGPIRILECFT